MMAKRVAAEKLEVIEITNGRIKGYHEYKIKLPLGSKVNVQRETGGRDEQALLCIVAEDLPDEILSQKMVSKSSKKSYYVRDVIGKVMGRVQYFLNKAMCELMDEGKVISITGIVTGNPEFSRSPPAHQHWVKNFQTGGGVSIPCTWKLQICGDPTKVVDFLKKRLNDVDGAKDVEVKISSTKS